MVWIKDQIGNFINTDNMDKIAYHSDKNASQEIIHVINAYIFGTPGCLRLFSFSEKDECDVTMHEIEVLLNGGPVS